MELREAADTVLCRLKTSQPALQLDPATILVIIKIIQLLLPLVLDMCEKEPEDIPSLATNALRPTSVGDRINYWFTRRAVIRELGRARYRDAGGDALLAALLEEASMASVEDLESLCESENL